MTADAVVIGGGITGLVLCHELHRRGVDVRLLERGEEPGGVIRSVEREGRILDLGPQRTRLTPEVRRLVDELGAEGELREAATGLPLYVVRDGGLRRVPRSASEFVATDLLSWRGKLRFLVEPFTAGPRSGETVAGFLERSFGREAYLHLFGPLYGGIYGSDPRSMPVEFSLARALEQHGMGRSALLGLVRHLLFGGDVAPAVSFHGGMAVLARRLADRHAERVSLGRKARTVEADRGRATVVTADGESLEAPAVILTVPAGAAASLLEGTAPATARVLASLTYNPLVLVHLLSDFDREGYGFQVSLAERRLVTRGVTWNYSLFDREELSTAYLGGAIRAEVAGADDEAVARRAAEEYTRITGAPARPIHVHRTRMPAFDRSWRALRKLDEGGDLPECVHLCASYQIRPGIPGRIRQATALADRIAGGEGLGGPGR